MKIIVVSMRSDGKPNDILESVIVDYFDNTLINLGHTIVGYDFMASLTKYGKFHMNNELYSLVEQEKPDLVLFVPSQNEFIPEILLKIKSLTVTLAYFFDDAWRISYCKNWSKFYTYSTTSSVNGLMLWRERGCNNFLYSPFAVNSKVFKKNDVNHKFYDVTFIGSYHPYRAYVLKKISNLGISVGVWGRGWPGGEVTQDQMVDIFNKSKINLNISNNDCFDIDYIFDLRRPLLETLRVFKKAFISKNRTDSKNVEMVKARHFEINACGSFQLSYYVEGLEKHFDIGNELVIYGSLDELLWKVKYFLNNEKEREIIAAKGYHKVITKHTLEKRFASLFLHIQNCKS
jgi:spore maturation protein CgeB